MGKQHWLEVWGFRAYPTNAAASESSTARLRTSATIAYAEMLRRITERPAVPPPREIAEV